MKIFNGTASRDLAEKIAKILKIELSRLELNIFPDEEKRVRVVDKVVGQDCIVVQSTSTNADKNYMELFFIVDALKRSGARSVTAVIPYLGYQRQDHVFREGEAVSLEVIIKTLKAVGTDKIVTFDLHSIKIPELFHIPVVHLSALRLFAEKISGVLRSLRQFKNFSNASVPAARYRSPRDTVAFGDSSEKFSHAKAPRTPVTRFSDTVLVSPDMGGIRRIKILSRMLGNLPYVTIKKNRDLKSGKIKVSKIHGSVGKVAFVVDDMISTGNTIAAAAQLLRKKGAEKIVVFATHPVFSGNAAKILQESEVEKVFVTDTIEVSEEKQFEKLEVLSVAEMIAEILMYPNRNTSN